MKNPQKLVKILDRKRQYSRTKTLVFHIVLLHAYIHTDKRRKKNTFRL